MARTMTDQSTRTRLGERLRSRRLQLGLTQDEAADQIEVKRDTYARWEQGRNFPDINHLRTTQEVLGIQLTDLAANNAGLDGDQFSEILKPLEEAIQRVERQLEGFGEEIRRLQAGD